MSVSPAEFLNIAADFLRFAYDVKRRIMQGKHFQIELHEMDPAELTAYGTGTEDIADAKLHVDFIRMHVFTHYDWFSYDAVSEWDGPDWTPLPVTTVVERVARIVAYHLNEAVERGTVTPPWHGTSQLLPRDNGEDAEQQEATALALLHEFRQTLERTPVVAPMEPNVLQGTTFEELFPKWYPPNYNVQFYLPYWDPLQAVCNIFDLDPEVARSNCAANVPPEAIFTSAPGEPSPILKALEAIDAAITEGELLAYVEVDSHSDNNETVMKSYEPRSDALFRSVRPCDALEWASGCCYGLADTWLRLCPSATLNEEIITSTQAAKRYQSEMDETIKLNAARVAVTRACNNRQIRSTGSGNTRRIFQQSLDAWILKKRNKSLENE